MRRSQIDRPDAGAKTGPSARATIAILDFGSQYTQLIARRVRESRVYCEIFPHDITPAELRAKNVIGVILSGGPASVYDEGAPSVDPRVINGDFRVLGICYGMQLRAHLLGGDVVAEGKREYGPATIEIADRAGIFVGLSAQERAWVSHGDTVRRPPDGFSVVARTTSVPIAAITDGKTRYAVQFHPEVAHTPHGAEIRSGSGRLLAKGSCAASRSRPSGWGTWTYLCRARSTRTSSNRDRGTRRRALASRRITTSGAFPRSWRSKSSSHSGASSRMRSAASAPSSVSLRTSSGDIRSPGLVSRCA